MENSLLRQKLDAFIRRYFGKKSETLTHGQLELLLSGIAPAPVTSVPEPLPQRTGTRRRNGGSKVRTPDNLEVVQMVSL